MSDAPVDSPSGSKRLSCPYCGRELEAVRAMQAQVVACPFCSRSFILPGLDGSVLAVAGTPQGSAGQPFAVDHVPDERADELDGVRIRQIAAERRAAYRVRSYLLVGAMGCAAAVGQLVWMICGSVRARGWGMEAALYSVGAVLCAIVAGWLFARAVRIRRETERSALGAPTRPPDFTGLGDGSQRWKNLDDIH